LRTLTLRIYLTVVTVLALFAFASGWVFQRHIEQERTRANSVLSERMAAWGELIQRSLPGADAPPADQAAALADWSQRLRIPLALDSPQGQRVGASDSYLRRSAQGGEGINRGFPIKLEDGRTLWVMRPGLRANANRDPNAPPGSPPPPGSNRGPGAQGEPPFLNLPFLPPALQHGVGLVIVLLVLFIAVAVGAYPVVRALTRRLQALKQGMETFGAGNLSHRVEVAGRDEVASVASSFNAAAARIEALVRSHQSLLANASHELRSPLARLKMAVSMIDESDAAQRARLKREIDTNVAELDALVEEVLLASRLDALRDIEQRERIDVVGLAAEEASRVDATVEAPPDGQPVTTVADERLVRRALRNLLENARRYGGDEVSVLIRRQAGSIELRVCDRGPGVPADLRERIFEPFYRLPGHAERSGGVGLGLSLVKQIAQRHGGSVRCEPHEGGGSCFVFALPAS
jgi:signal transduction histidine kinase